MKEREHIYYFDGLRLMACFFVVYMHTAANPLRNGFGTDWELMNVITSLSFTAVPLFFMISGYLLISSPRTADIPTLLKKRLPRLIIPLAFWTLAAILWSLLSWHDFSLHSFFSRCVDALNQPAMVHLWYMYTLIAMYVLSPLIYGAIRSLDKNGHTYVLCLIGLVTLQSIASALLPANYQRLCEIDLINKLRIFGGHMCSFLLGWYLGNMKKRIKPAILFPAAALLLAVIVFGTHSVSHSSGEYTQTFQRQDSGFEVLLAASLFLIFRQYLNKPLKLLRSLQVVPLLFSVYLMHNIVLDAVNRYVYSPDTFPGTLLCSAGIFIVCLLFLKSAASVKPLCYAVTGVRFDDACKSCNWQSRFASLKKKRAGADLTSVQ